MKVMSGIDYIILYLFLFGASFVWSKANSLHRKQFSIIFALLYPLAELNWNDKHK